MGKIYRRICNKCGLDYVGKGKFFCSSKCSNSTITEEKIQNLSKSHTGVQAREKNPNWRGGKTRCLNGYIKILKPEHGRADSKGYVFEHLVVMEKHIKRPVESGEEVHHINRIKSDNRIANLSLMDRKEHRILHIKERHSHV